MAKSVITQNRNYIVEFYKSCDTRQIMDVGKSIPSTFEPRGKAKGLIGIMSRFPIGYKVDYATLVSRKWKSWIKGDPYFKDSDVLSATDVKGAIKGFYLQVLKGELKFSDGEKKMLSFEMYDNGRLVLKVVPFMKCFKVVEPKTKNENEEEGKEGDKKAKLKLPEGMSLLEALEELQNLATSEAETEVFTNAIAEMKKIKGSVIVGK